MPNGRGNTASQAIEEGKKWIGTPYKWGGGGRPNGETGFDCSHFVCHCYNMGYLSTAYMVTPDSALGSRDFERLSYNGNSKEGDILVYNGHTGIRVKEGELQAYGGSGPQGDGGRVGILGIGSAPWTTIWRPKEGAEEVPIEWRKSSN